MTDKEVEVTVLESLSVEEESERLRLERKVEKAFFEAGLALQTLRDKRLWRSTHYSFKEYCQDRFAFSFCEWEAPRLLMGQKRRDEKELIA
jgi:hypothetical protein